MAEIRVLETRGKRASRDVVEVLERCLELARRGDFTAVAVAAVYVDGGGYKCWSEGDEANALVGAVALLEHRLAEQINAGGTEDVGDG
jgi:hypothetical protein